MSLIAADFLLLVPLVLVGGLSFAVAAVGFIILLLAASIMTAAVRRVDPESIVSLRRTFGLLLASTLIWTIFTVFGVVYSGVASSPRTILGEFTLGAFLAWSFDLVVVNGAFLIDTKRSLSITAMHPVPLLFLAMLSSQKPGLILVYPLIGGIAILLVTTLFILGFKSYKTDGVGINSLEIFQSFLKTWVTHRPSKLEGHFALYSRNQPVTTDIILATGKERAAVILPGVHPGPFFPVGSYNLSELIYQEIRRAEIVPMVLHGVGGHEKNLPTNALARDYAKQVGEAAIVSKNGHTTPTMRGPVHARIGLTGITLLGFADRVIALVSNSPLNTDDLDPEIIDDALSAARQTGLHLVLVDAHNSIGGENATPIRITEGEWKEILTSVSKSEEDNFDMAIAHSSDIGFSHGSDISEGGIGVLLFRKKGSKYALVSADANNAITGLRERIADELKHDGTELIELCTSDTHNSAARGLVNRGYHALGEDTSQEEIIAAVRQLTKIATDELTAGTVTSAEVRTNLPLIGSKSLEDFASLTERTLRYTKSSARLVAVLVALLFLVTLFY